jgi:hypothetical protein
MFGQAARRRNGKEGFQTLTPFTVPIRQKLESHRRQGLLRLRRSRKTGRRQLESRQSHSVIDARLGSSLLPEERDVAASLQDLGEVPVCVSPTVALHTVEPRRDQRDNRSSSKLSASSADLEERLETQVTAVLVDVRNGDRGNLWMGTEALLRELDENDRLS